MTKISIIENGNEVILAKDNLPIKIGTDESSDISILGPISFGTILIVDFIEGKYFLQKIKNDVNTLINNENFNGNVIVKTSDRLEIGNKVVVFEYKDEDFILHVNTVDSSSQPTIFEEKNTSGKLFSRKKLKNFFVLFIVFLSYFLFYLFTSKAVEFEVEPQEVNINISGGFFPQMKIGDRYLLKQGEYNIQLMSEGYYPFEDNISVEEEPSQKFNFSLRKLPGRIFLGTNPQVELVIKVDEVEIPNSEDGVYEINAGQRSIEILTNQYKPIKDQLVIQGMNEEQSFIFDLVPAWAELKVGSIPDDTEIFVDKTLKGKTPATIKILQGSRMLQLKKNGYKLFDKKLDIVAGENYSLDVINLERLDSKIRINSVPKGASVTIDSIYRGMTPINLELEPLINHQILLSKPGYNSLNTEFNLPIREDMEELYEDGRLQLDQALQPIFGKINFRGTVGAKIISDGKEIGIIPSKLVLLSKEQKLLFEKEGYVSQEFTVNPTPKLEQSIAINLMTPEETVIAAMPRRVNTYQGSKMQLVLPGETFLMGSPRGDQGRKTNEIERLVQITRPFYVGITEVTNKQFREFRPQHTSGAEVFRELSNNLHPTVMVTWQDAAEYCNWLSKKDSLDPAYEIKKGKLELIRPVTNGYRLLTEAEWEWISRYNGGGGLQKYPWGQRMPVMEDSGNYADESAEVFMDNTLKNYWDGYPVTSPTGKFKANPLGLYDLGGNVAEWVSDYYSVYPKELNKVTIDPLGPMDGTATVIKGSSYRKTSISNLRYSFRDSGISSRLDVGFRIARYSDTLE